MWRPPTPRRSPSGLDETSRSTSRSRSSGSILPEALRRNPFRSQRPLPPLELFDETQALNKDLGTLAEVFPDVQVGVLREVLIRYDGESRLLLCTEQLYKYHSEWARGRLRNPPREDGEQVPLEEQFRGQEYIGAVKRTLNLEFRALTRGAVDAVLAETNNSYRNARPILQGLANKTWKVTFTSLFRKKRIQEEPPLELFEKGKVDLENPKLVSTGSAELDEELKALFFTQRLLISKQIREVGDHQLAARLNLQEAEEAEALFECQICLGEVPFEDIATCTTEGHVMCLDCIRRTLQEALFGQGWSQSVDSGLATLRCIAPSAETCQGHVDSKHLQRAILSEKSGQETWTKFEDRLADHSLHKSNIPFVRCPFCPYAEAEPIYSMETAKEIPWRFRNATGSNVLVLILILEIIPFLFAILLPLYILKSAYVLNYFYLSLSRLSQSHRTSRFRCMNPACHRRSCLTCHKAWHDPHICHEPLILSLRNAVESARTAAVKRTCPRCGTSFVKSSGCNKLTCVCGYSMCYLCRKNIGKTGEEGGEGYRHFCEHFRPILGQKCTECDKCDLYKSEDEDAAVRRAGEEAERVWREREGMIGVEGLDVKVGLDKDDTFWYKLWSRNWSVQDVVDWAVWRTVMVDER